MITIWIINTSFKPVDSLWPAGSKPKPTVNSCLCTWSLCTSVIPNIPQNSYSNPPSYLEIVVALLLLLLLLKLNVGA